jgi:ornithine carbamoyltransferase
MKPMHLVSIQDLNSRQLLDILKNAAAMKKAGKPSTQLAGKTLGLIFHKPSVRTRVSFEVGMAQLGGQSLYIGPVELEQGKRESAKDMALVLSRYLDAIVARTFSHSDVVEMAEASSVPVINGLSDESHPCQALADLMTVQEKTGKLAGVTIAYVGDGNNVCHSLMEACALAGANLSVGAPKGYAPDPAIVDWSKRQAKKTGAKITITEDPIEAVHGARVIYTDVWTSMGQEKEKQERIRVFSPYQVNEALMKKAAPNACFMHCLPAHRGEEVTNGVIDSPRSVVYDQAENRMHAQKAVLLMLLEKSK